MFQIMRFISWNQSEVMFVQTVRNVSAQSRFSIIQTERWKEALIIDSGIFVTGFQSLNLFPGILLSIKIEWALQISFELEYFLVFPVSTLAFLAVLQLLFCHSRH
jgi:hypothetical protein